MGGGGLEPLSPALATAFWCTRYDRKVIKRFLLGKPIFSFMNYSLNNVVCLFCSVSFQYNKMSIFVYEHQARML